MKKIRYLALAICAIAISSSVFAYDQPTHYDLSTVAVQQSVLKMDPAFLGNLGLPDKTQKFPATPATLTEGDSPLALADLCTHGSKYTFDTLIACGSEFEDAPGTRSLNHFYDPIRGIPLTVIGLTPGLTSPDWAIKDGNVSSYNVFSYKDAHDYFYQALTTTTTQSDRDTFWGKLFQSLGQVIHHVEDMAQPQHVRNDEHVDQWWSRIFGLYNPSLYESYTSGKIRPALISIMAGPGSNAVYTASSPNGFTSARDFWTNTNAGGVTGLAQFTNGNFVSAGTNFQILGGQPVAGATYDFPKPGLVEDVQLQNLTPAMVPAISSYCGNGLSCSMTFYSSVGANVTQLRASTLSIFDQYVNLRPVLYLGGLFGSYQTNRVFTLNQYNFSAIYPTILPRAVSYSAGLINFFFRGKMQLSLPPEGVYSLIDPSTSASGFSKVKLMLTNTSPAGENMIGGNVVAVAKYHNNNCYRPDLSGEYGLPGADYASCRSSDEKIVVSAPLPLTLAVGDPAAPLVFDFSSSPIPLSATDLYLQVVYRGQLGQEVDAVAVTTLDIAEPTTFDLTNMTDYFLLNGVYYYIPSPYNNTTVIPGGLGTPASNTVAPTLFAYIDINHNGVYDLGIDQNLARISLSYSFNLGGRTTLGSVTLPPSSFGRFAFLANKAPVMLNLTKVTYGYSVSIPITPTINQFDPVSGPVYMTPYFYRGKYQYGNSPDYGFDPTVVPISPFLPALNLLVPQTITFPP